MGIFYREKYKSKFLTSKLKETLSGSWMQKSAEGSCAGKQQHHGAKMQEKSRMFMGKMDSMGERLTEQENIKAGIRSDCH